MANDDAAHSAVWGAIRTALETDERITPQMRGFLDLIKPKGIMAGTIYLEVPNDYTRSMIEQRARIPLLAALGGLGDDAGVATFAIVTNPDIEMDTADAAPPTSEIPIVPDTGAATGGNSPAKVASTTRLNPKYSFDNFVIGQSNRFAHAAAVAVAEAPAKAYNPLFIYGDSGLGKTHLLHAIGHYAISLYPGLRVRYVSSEEFTNDFINSIAENRGSAFQSRYRTVDLLLIDDIQFLQGKAETQEAFFHTFNTLHDHNKQVVITSDLPPKLLTGFEDRMRSRFEWGLLTDVQAPDLETRIAILRKKAQSERVQFPDEVLELIATKVSSSIRELEGVLIRIAAFSSLNRSPVDISLVQTVLKDLITLDADNVIAPTDIIQNTADYYRLSVDELYGSSRSQEIAKARQIAMYLCRELTSLSLPKIGQLFGGRDHTTVMYANRKISELIRERRSVYNEVAELTTRIKQGRR
ncbi:chromosomal replication initiator protein DnaA [Gryllotalpicola sp.]|uniref:chromosomal replication initiator protein DnaA n=1 Tax=Gryllotalpicola sp. TaxID=1932787 RepID=UPI002616DE34|nr:chromosomal replication initiator protein DnaA [Gryllotalpicola sp.]